MFEVAVDAALDAVLITTGDLDLPGPVIVYANQAWARMTGYGASELVGRSPRILQGGRTDRTVLARMRHELALGLPFRGRVINYRKDGTEFLLEWQVVEVTGADDKSYYVSVQRDVWAQTELPRPIVVDTRDVITLKRTPETDQSREMLRSVIQASEDAFILLRAAPADGPLDFTVIDCNARAERMLGRMRDELIGRPWSSLEGPAGIGDRNALAAAFLDTAARDEVIRTDVSENETLWHRRNVVVAEDCIAVSLRDVTDDHRLSDQLRQAQKMEALGRLAGSVAHDFNNMLSAILGFSRLAHAQIADGHPARADLAEVIAAGERSAALTQQLLAFSRRQVLAPRVIDAARELGAIAGVLRRLVGESVALETAVTGPVCIKVDPTQFEQVVLNLVVNARDATPPGGAIHVSLAVMTIAGADVDVAPGEYAALTVSDTGRGMSNDVQTHMFEPFYTTKERGRGTGLGLSTVLGIVQQSGGHIRVHSIVGEGTTISVLLPLATEKPDVDEVPRHTAVDLTGRTALVVDDEPSVRAVCARVLREAGMTALEAADGEQALQIDSSHAGSIDVLLTDVVMPRMHGRLLADLVRARRPGIRVLYMSGYTDDIMHEHGVDTDQPHHILQKPLDARVLLERMRDLVNTSG